MIENIRKIIESDPIVLPTDINRTSALELMKIISNLRDRSNIVSRAIGLLKIEVLNATSDLALAKRDNSTAYREYLTTDPWVNAGRSAEERKVRATQKAAEDAPLGSKEETLNELKLLQDVLYSVSNSLETARQDVSMQIQLLRISISAGRRG